MSHANGMVRFVDDVGGVLTDVIMHCEYNGTCDFMCTALWDTNDEMHQHWRAEDGSYSRACTCGKEPEDIRLYTDYGREYHWSGKACRGCRAITDGVEPPFGADSGMPDWVKAHYERSKWTRQVDEAWKEAELYEQDS